MTGRLQRIVGVVLGMSASVALVFALTATEPVHRHRWAARVLQYAGNDYECNLCGWGLRRFERSLYTNDELQCPFCFSRPRHRTAYVFFQRRTNLFDGAPKRMLHVAPEFALIPKFKSAPNLDYLSGDLNGPAAGAMVHMDITDIQYPDASFDVIYCSHVLEHVPQDRKAMRELARVLKPGGWALISVPIIRNDATLEDPRITSPEDRESYYGQWDHVRAYGPDFVDRLREAGFDVTIDRFARNLSEEDVRRHGLSRDDLFVCKKPAG